jgi:hypothetical protein
MDPRFERNHRSGTKTGKIDTRTARLALEIPTARAFSAIARISANLITHLTSAASKARWSYSIATGRDQWKQAR